MVSLSAGKKKKRKSSKDKRRQSSGEEEVPLSLDGAGAGSSRMSLEIVNETGGPDGDVQKSSVDLVEEELANMAVAESLDDLATAPEDMPVKKASSSPSRGSINVVGEAEDDGALVVNIARSKFEKRSFPGTPTSTSSSVRSSQDSSSSTKHLLPKPGGTEGIGDTRQASVQIVPSTAATVVNVAPSETDGEC